MEHRKKLYGDGFTDAPEVRETMEPLLPSYWDRGMNERFYVFVGLTPRDARRLMEQLPAGQEEDRQNWSPTFETFVAVAEEYDGLLIGYVVGSERWDERVTVDGILVPEEPEEALRRLRFREILEPPVHRPDEYDAGYTFDGREYHRLWWD